MTPTKALQELRDEMRSFSGVRPLDWSNRIDAILTALASATGGQGEPVAWARVWYIEKRDPRQGEGAKLRGLTQQRCLPTDLPLYTPPAARITEEQIKERFEESHGAGTWDEPDFTIERESFRAGVRAALTESAK